MLSDRPGTPRPQRADAAHDQIDLHAGLRGLVERLDHLRFEQRIHLGDDARLAAGTRDLGLGADRADQIRVQREGRLPQVVQRVGPAQSGQLLEHFVDVGADLLVAGEQAEVGVEAGRARVVVAGAQVHVAAQPAFLAPHHHQHLGVGLVADHAVDHVRADLLQPRGPVDVGLLVEARHQLDHHRDFLAASARRAAALPSAPSRCRCGTRSA